MSTKSELAFSSIVTLKILNEESKFKKNIINFGESSYELKLRRISLFYFSLYVLEIWLSKHYWEFWKFKYSYFVFLANRFFSYR